MLVLFSEHNVFKKLLNLFISFLIVLFVGCGGDAPQPQPQPLSPDPVTIESISISPFQINLAKQTSLQLQVTAVLSDGSVNDVTDQVSWQVQDNLIAQINNQGILSSIVVGSTKITASVENVSAYANLTVTPATLIALTISPGFVSLASGSNQFLKVTGIFSDQSVQDITSQVSWQTTANTIATVNASGLLVAGNSGQASITASLNGISHVVNIDVTAANLTALSITPGTTVLAKGSHTQLQVAGLYSDNSSQDLSALVTWQTSNPAVATVSAEGFLQGITTGNANISASLSGISVSADVSVTDAILTALSISPGSVALASGTTEQLQVLGQYSDTSVQVLSSQVNWQSNDNSVAEVSPSGVVKANAVGATSLQASLDGIESTINITVSAATLSSIQITPAVVSLPKGTTQQVTATGIYSDATTQNLSSQVSWQSSDSSIASISASGLLTAQSVGSVSFTAGFNGVSGSAEVAVTSATLNAISVTPSQVVLASGIEQQFTATGQYSDGSFQDVTSQSSWLVANGNILETVNNSPGRVKANATGTTRVTAALSGVSGDASVRVTSAVLTTLEVSALKSTVSAGSVLQFEATGILSDNSNQLLTESVAWLTSDQTIASINSQGVLQTFKTGSVTVTAIFNGLQISQVISVGGAVLTSIEITPLIQVLPLGSSQSFVATGIYSDYSVQDITGQVTWNSSDATIASIGNSADLKGQVQTLSSGVVTISAEKDLITASKILTVSDAVITSISVLPDISVIHVNSTETFKAIAQYSDGSTKEISNEVEWSISDSSIADSESYNNAVIRAFKTGTVTVNASDGVHVGFASLVINDAVLTSITLDNQNASIAMGTELKYIATGNYSDDSSRDISDEVSWTSDTPAVALVSNAVSKKGYVKGLMQGAATITATLSDVSTNTLLTVTSATLSSINVSAASTQLLVGNNLSISAYGMYSDGSEQDITSLVTWQSSANNIAAVSNATNTKGLLMALGQGMTSVTALFNGTVSNSLDINIQFDANAPISVSLIATPNAILNNGSDSTTITATIQPANSSGVIADNTLVDFQITEDGVSSTVTVATVGGIAVHSLASSKTGLISVTASVQGSSLSSSTGLLSVSSFNQVIIKGAYSNSLIDGVNLLAGSEFGLLARNISNRDFNIDALYVLNGIEHLPDSPVAGADISDGILEGSEVLWVVYILDVNVADNGVSASLFLNDAATTSSFGFRANYNSSVTP